MSEFHYIEATWSTERRDRLSVKEAVHTNVNIVGDGSADSTRTLTEHEYFVKGFKWNIFLNIDELKNGKDGVDVATSAIYTDTMRLPDGIVWPQKVLDSIRAGRYSMIRRVDSNRRQRYYLSVDGRDLLYLAFPTDAVAYNVSFDVNDRKEVVAHWTLRELQENQELTTSEVIVGVEDDALMMDLSELTIDDRAVTEQDFPMAFEIWNQVSADVNYTHSGIQTTTAEAMTTATARPADMAIAKQLATDAEYVYRLGEDVTFNVTVSNNGALPSTGLHSVTDTLDGGNPGMLETQDSWLMYIKPRNMARMFDEAAQKGLALTITVENAKTAAWTPDAVMGESATSASGSGSVTLDSHNSGKVTLSQGETMTITREGTEYRVRLGGETRTGADLGALLDAMNYRVAYDDLYTVTWTFPEAVTGEGTRPYSFAGGLDVVLPIYATHKDTLQMLTADHPVRYLYDSDWTRTVLNTATLDYDKVTCPDTPRTTVQLDSADPDAGDRSVTRVAQDADATSTVEANAQLTSNETTHRVTYELSVNKAEEGVGTVGQSSKDSYRNNNVRRFKISANNRGVEDYSAMPVTDSMTGAQLLLVRASENSQLEGMKLDTVTVDKIKYYVLAPTGNDAEVFTDVFVGHDATGRPLKAARVSVIRSTGKNSEGIDVYNYATDIAWYFDSLPARTELQIQYETMAGVFLVHEDQSDSMAAKLFAYDNTAYLNNLKGDRLLAHIGGSGSTFGMSKKLVERTGLGYDPLSNLNHSDETLDADDFSVLTRPSGRESTGTRYQLPENTAMYRLAVEYDPNNPTYSVSFGADEIYDLLPDTYGVFDWTLSGAQGIGAEGNVFVEARTECDGGAVTIRQGDSVIDVGTLAEGMTIEERNGRQYLCLPDGASVVIRGKAKLVFYVTCTYAGADNWTKYCDKTLGRQVENTFFVCGRQDSVTHDLQDGGEPYLQKGVNYIYQASVTDSRVQYDNFNGLVEYYVAVYNGGNSRMYLDTLYDELPRGFTFHGVYNRALAYNDRTKKAHSNETTTLDNSAMNATPAENRPARITDENLARSRGADFSAQFVSARIVADDSAAGVVKFNITGGVAYDKLEQRYYLLPGQAIAFSYLADVDASTSATDDSALNRVYMNVPDPLKQGFKPYTFQNGGVEGAQRTVSAENAPNDGDCTQYNKVSDGIDGLQSYVSVYRGKLHPDIEKEIREVTLNGTTRSASSGETLVGAAEKVGWQIKLRNDGARVIDSYSFTDTMHYPYRPMGDVVYSVISSINGATYESTVYDASGSFRRPLFTIESYSADGKRVRVKDLNGALKWIGFGDTPVSMTLPCVKLNYGNVTEVRQSTEDAPLTFGLSFTRDAVSGDITMKVDMPAGLLDINPGAHGLVTVYTAPEFNASGAYPNAATFIPGTLDYNPGQVKLGTALVDGNRNLGVRAVDRFNIITGGGTTSHKNVREDRHTGNDTDKLKRDAITLADGNNSFTYTLNVNSTMQDTMQRLVIVDNLPQVGDQYTSKGVRSDGAQISTARGSEFKVYFKDGDTTHDGRLLNGVAAASEQCDNVLDGLSVRIIRDGQTIDLARALSDAELTENTYTLEFSDKTEFTQADLRGRLTIDDETLGAEGWTYSDSDEVSNLSAGYRSLRVVIPQVQKNDQVIVQFQAYADKDARPSRTAWNGFAYSYLMGGDGSVESQWGSAFPNLVGVRIPASPQLQKQLVNAFGDPARANAKRDFYFLVYTGTAALDGALHEGPDGVRNGLLKYGENGALTLDNDLPVLTEAAIAQLTEAAKQETGVAQLDTTTEYWKLVKVSVDRNQSESATVNLYGYEFWQKGRTYSIVELETDPDYRLAQFINTFDSESSTGGLSFVYADNFTQSFTARNAYIPWDFQLAKLSVVGDKRLNGAVFALYSPRQDDLARAITGLTYAAGETYAYPGDDSLRIPTTRAEGDGIWYLIDVKETARLRNPETNRDEDGLIRWSGLRESVYLYQEYRAPAGYNLPEDGALKVRVTDMSKSRTWNTAQVYNTPGVSLPATGGSGTTPCYVAGAALLLLALALLLRKRSEY